MNERAGRSRFHAADLFLVLLALFAVVGVAKRAGAFRKNTADSQSDYLIQAVWSDTDSRSVACLRAGDVLYTNAGERFGEISEIRSEPSEAVLWENGKRIVTRYPAGTREDVFLTVAVRGGEHDGVFLRENGRAVLIGETYRLYSLRASVAATVTAVTPLKTAVEGQF